MYDNEERISKEAREFLKKNPFQDPNVSKEFGNLVNAYDNLLADQKFITKISDRLQNKLSTINESLQQKKQELEKTQKIIAQQNEELKIAKENLEEKVQDRTKELEKAYNDLVMSNKELDTFVYRASHDLKGPIATLLGLCNVALMDISDKGAIDYINMLVGTASQMDHMLFRLLTVNKLKKSEPIAEKFNIYESIESLNTYLVQFRGFDHIEYKVKYPKKLQLFADKEIFQMLLENLLEYAIKNSIISRRHDAYINLNVLNETKSLQIYLSYNGNVIPESINSDVFNLFHRTTNKTGHSGIELYTVSQAAEKLKGNVELISSSESETLFSVFLPEITSIKY